MFGSPARRRIFIHAVLYSLAAAVCFFSAVVLWRLNKYGWWGPAIQVALTFLWCMAASRSWFRWYSMG